MPEIMIPMNNDLEMFWGSVKKPYRNMRRAIGPFCTGFCSDVSGDFSSSGEAGTCSTAMPHIIPERKAASIRNTAKTQPNKAVVISRLSTPVCGVEARKDAVAPRLAPCFLSVAARGMTPQEQIGIGTPIKAALNAQKKPRPPRCLRTYSLDISSDSMPAKRKPNNK